MKRSNYDSVVLGGGFAGMACALRQGMFQQNVLLLEKHILMGGLNSYYYRKVGEKKVRIDTGLHALTNYTVKGERSSKVLPQILKQFRISHDELNLKEQSYSKIVIDGRAVLFSNKLDLLRSEITREFPLEIDNFEKFLLFIKDAELRTYKENDLFSDELLNHFFSNQSIKRILSFPILCYGSAWEEKIDAYIFISMFRSIYLEGFARPAGGIKTLIDLMVERISRYPSIEIVSGVGATELRQENTGWDIQTSAGKIQTPMIFSSIGYPETKILCGAPLDQRWISPISFVEVIFIFNERNKRDHPETIIFFNETESLFRGAEGFVDFPMGVICQLENYQDSSTNDTLIKITFCGNFKKWNSLDPESYKAEKEKVIEQAKGILCKYLPKENRTPLYIDCFTPRTITKYTSHVDGAVYGSFKKFKSGLSDLNNIVMIGADQANLGVTGSILSGADMANKYILRN